MLARTLVNVIILTREQLPFVTTVQGLIHEIVKLLLLLPSDVLLKSEMEKKRNIVLLYTHLLRLIIVCQSIDLKTIDNMRQDFDRLQRHFNEFEIAFPLSKLLTDSLKGDVVWFKHDESNCKIISFYTKSEPKSILRVCSNCQKLDSDLKVCSRCRNSFYCDATCQKAHYPKHKPECLKSK